METVERHVSPRKLSELRPSLYPGPPRVYQLARENVFPAGVVIRLGRRLLFDLERHDSWIAAGGAALPGGWRRAPKPDAGDRENARG